MKRNDILMDVVQPIPSQETPARMALVLKMKTSAVIKII
jgi:hypothetical protein